MHGWVGTVIPQHALYSVILENAWLSRIKIGLFFNHMTSRRIRNNEICRPISFPNFIRSENLFFSFFSSQGNSAPNLCHTSHETQGAAPHTSTQCRKANLREQNPGISYSQGKPSGPIPNAGHPTDRGAARCTELSCNLPQSGHPDLRCLCTLDMTQSTHHPADLLPTAMWDF